jgi:hypothetical protein
MTASLLAGVLVAGPMECAAIADVLVGSIVRHGGSWEAP